MNKTEEQSKIDNDIKAFEPQKVEDAYIQRPSSLDVSEKKDGGGVGGGGSLTKAEELIKRLEERIESLEKRAYFSEKLNEVFDTAPTYIPKNFREQFCFYKVGAERRLYTYIDGAWAYKILT